MSLFNLYKRFNSTKNLSTLREQINESLYNPNKGQFTKEITQVGIIKNKIKFNELLGHEEYKRKLREQYPENAWLTPVEIFSPFQTQTILEHIMKHKSESTLNIIEIGGGNGTFLIDFLDKLSTIDYQLQINNLNQYFVEVGQASINQTQNRINSTKHSKLISKNKIRFINESLFDLNQDNQFKSLVNKQTFIICMEVLDNFSHDRVLIKRNNNIINFHKLSQVNQSSNNDVHTMVDLDINDNICKTAQLCMDLQFEFQSNYDYQERQQQIYRNPIHKRIIYWYWDKIRNKFDKSQEVLQIPTDMVRFVEKLKYFNNPQLIVADFDNLVKSDQPLIGSNTPIISKKLELADEKLDTDDFFKYKGEVDIFFPVDFKFLRFLLFKMHNIKSVIRNTDEFVLTYANQNWAVTKSGYRPIQEDFANTSILSNM